MNILFFLTPKEDVSYLPEDYTFRQALEQLFALYTPAEKPLYARTSTAQCLLSTGNGTCFHIF